MPGGSARAGSGEPPVITDFEVRAVCRKPGPHLRSHARGEIAADGGRSVEHDLRFVSGDQLAHDPGIRARAVVLEAGIFHHVDLVGPESDQTIGEFAHVLAGQHGPHRHLQPIRQFPSLATELQRHVVEARVLLLREDPDFALSVKFDHAKAFRYQR